MRNEFLKRISSMIILIPFVFFFIINGSFLFNLFIILCFIISAYEWHMMSKKKKYYILGLIFLIFSFCSIYLLRNNFTEGYHYLLFIIVACISTDIGGYLFGNIFKGPKLTKISPKKTYSGMCGSYLLAILSSYFLTKFIIIDSSIKPNIHLFIFSFFISTISQLGDLVISYFKRLSKIKDTGKLIPGHGGLLDRIDGMIFAFPFSYLILLTNII
jgi:phosphatidate cytidylyltransferase